VLFLLQGPRTPADPLAKELSGTYAARQNFFLNDDGGTVIGVLTTGEIIRGPLQSPTDLQSGTDYRFLGRWEDHPKWGWQFAFGVFICPVPRTQHALVSYLSYHVPHIGKVTAEKLWDAYGAAAAEVLTENPERVVADGLLTAEHVQEAAEWLRDNADDQDAKIELHNLFARRGFPRTLPATCLTKWGAAAPERIRRNPFVLLVHRLPFCSFSRCDNLYLDLNHPPGRLKRQALCAWHAVASSRDGHTWLSIQQALDAVRAKIAGAEQRPEQAVRMMIRACWLAYRRDDAGQLWVAESAKARDERTVATSMRQLLRGDALWPAEAIEGLSQHQRDVLRPLLRHPVLILLGTPGTGKTHTAAALIRSVVNAYGQAAVAVCAPTGKAAVRLTENLARRSLSLTATTIHRLLGCQFMGKFQFAHNADNPLPHRFVVIDETSMLDAELAASLLSACGPGTNVLMVGDPYQLAPVGHGAPLRDFVAAGIPHGELTEIQRNSGMIVRACAEIKSGKSFETCEKIDLAAGKNLRIVEVEDAEKTIQKLKEILDRFKASASRDVFEDVQILTATRRARALLNRELQQHLNPRGKQVRGRVFRQGDKVICLKNSRFSVAREVRGGPKEEYVANGDQGLVEEINDGSMIVRLKFPERVVRVPLGKVRERNGGDENGEEDENTGCAFHLAYAITGHKYQGSECPVIIVIADRGAGPVASREWWYTALSRAKELCMLLGKRGTVERQCERVSLRDRKTFLSELLKEEMS
jgi:exodeoxyribonuclease V alpha subunit